MTDFQQFVGPFQLHEQMGHTPITNRYRATDKRNDQAVTLYILTPDAAQQPSLVEQFLNIGSQAMRLQHPGLVPVVDVGDAQGFIYIATQWIEGQSLADRLRWANSVVNVEAAAYILNALAAALDYAHQQGFVHGHITLDQIYITNNNEVLLDGLEQAFQAGKTVLTTTPAEGIVANPVVFISPYMAPEQAKAGEPIDQRADIYSLGAVLYAMLLGRPPFTGEISPQLLRAVVEEPPLPAETINPALPPAMIYVLKLVLSKDPSVRYANASEFANAFLQSTQWSTALPVNQQAAAYQRRGLVTRVLLPLLAILCVALLTGAGLGWFGERFAFLPAIQGGDLAARLRGLLGSDQVAAQLTAEPVMLTPVVMVTMTPPTATPASAIVTATPTAAAVAMAMSVTETATTTVITTVTVTASAPAATTPVTTPITTALPTPVNSATVTTTTTLTTGAPPANRTTALAAATGITATPSVTTSTLVIDPLGLLAGPVAAGTVIINGAAAPGAAVQVEVNGRSIGSTETKVSGTWSMIVDLSQPGAYDISATVVDGNGLVVATAQQPVTVVAAEATPTLDLSAIGIFTDTPPTTLTATVTPTPIAPTATNTVEPTATATAQPTATNAATPAPTATSTNTALPTATNTATPAPTATSTNTALPTATNTVTPAPTATVTNTPLPTATATNTSQPTATPVLQPTDTPTVETTATNTSQPTATATNTALPTATATNTPQPTATNTLAPTATATHTALPTATATNTPQPTATATNTPRPTATATNTPRPTATATNTPRPTATATNTPRPTATATNTPRPTATATNTPRPTATATNTPRPTATVTNTPRPTVTNTPVPTATNTPLPTATNTPVPPTNTPRPTNTPLPTATNTPMPTPTAVTGSIAPVSPGDGNSGQGQQTFTWTANFAPSEGYAFELVFWKADQDPLRQSFGMAAPTTNLNVTLDLPRLDEQLGPTFDTGEYRWGVILVRTTPTYERVQYLGGGYRFTYYRGGGDSGSGGQESGE
jgi:hypothetical protein